MVNHSHNHIAYRSCKYGHFREGWEKEKRCVSVIGTVPKVICKASLLTLFKGPVVAMEHLPAEIKKKDINKESNGRNILK